MGALLRQLLRVRERPAVQALERVARSLPPVDSLARRAYSSHKARTLSWIARDPELRQAFLGHRPLPPGYGAGMDERVVEYPWVLARIPHGPARILDAGSTLNHPWLADHAALQAKQLVLLTLAPEGVIRRREYSYLYGDLRDTLLRDCAFDLVLCISTLEHVGMDNRAYTGDSRDREHEPGAFREAVRELNRVLRPGGRLLLSVPYGRAQDLGWLQQFDATGLEAIEAAFRGAVLERAFFRHVDDEGWQVASPDDCREAEFLVRGVGGTMATRASAVACVALEKGQTPADV